MAEPSTAFDPTMLPPPGSFGNSASVSSVPPLPGLSEFLPGQRNGSFANASASSVFDSSGGGGGGVQLQPNLAIDAPAPPDFSAAAVMYPPPTVPTSSPPVAVGQWLADNGPAPAPAAVGQWTEYGMTQDLYDHMCAIFATFDADSSGRLDKREVTNLAKYLNYVHDDAGAERCWQEMTAYSYVGAAGYGSRGGGGGVARNDFFEWLGAHRPDTTALYGLSISDYHERLFYFHELDNGMRGSIDRDRWQRFALRFGYAQSFADAQHLFGVIDINRDGSLSLHEILRFLSKTRADGAPMPPQAQQQQHQQFYQQQPGHGSFRVVPGPVPGAAQQQQQGWQKQPPQQQQHHQQRQYPQQPQFRQQPQPQVNKEQADGCCVVQ